MRRGFIMKTLRWYGIHDVRPEELEKPAPAPGEVLVKVLYAGICGSDLHIYNKGMFIQNVPETMGHEFCGVIEALGEGAGEGTDTNAGADGLQPGDKVIANPMVPCGVCDSCRRGAFNTCSALGFIGEVRPGCFAEYISLPAEALIKVDPGSDMRLMALAEPLAVALNVCERAEFRQGDSLAVVGAGPIGLLTAAAARQVCGVQDVTVVNRTEPRRKIAEALGAKALAAFPEGAQFDRVVEAAGNPAAMESALSAVRAGGTLLPVSVFEAESCPIDMNLIVGGQITVKGCNCYTRKHLEQAAELLSSGAIRVDPVITDEMDLTEGREAFAKLCGKEKKAAKILFRME